MRRLALWLALAAGVVGVFFASASNDAHAVTPKNLSGAIVDSPGCHQDNPVEGLVKSSEVAALPFAINFLGRSYVQASPRLNGYITFNDDWPFWRPTWPKDQVEEDYNTYNKRLIMPFGMPLPDAYAPDGSYVTSYGETTYEGRRAFCVIWAGSYPVDGCLSSTPADTSKTNHFQLLLVERRDAGYEDFDIIFNYGSIQWDSWTTEEGEAIRGTGPCDDPAGAGWKIGNGQEDTRVLLEGSWTHGAFLDSNTATGLIHSSRGSSQKGRYIWEIRNGVPVPRLDPRQTYGSGGPDAWARNPTGSEGDPINTATGAYYASVTDLSLPGLGVPFELTRSYNSNDTSLGVLGMGWTHSLAGSLTRQASGDVLARSGDGQVVAFKANPDGTFSGASGSRAVLAEVADGYELKTHDQVRYGFDAQGKLRQKRDRNDQGLSLDYDSEGRLATVTDSAGRATQFSYANERLSRVALPDGRSASYDYDADGRLATVTDVEGGTTKYAYDPDGQLTSVQDPKGNVVVRNTYGSDGRVVRQLDARGKEAAFEWDPATETSTYTDPNGKKWRDVYAGNVLVDRIDPLGNRHHYTYDAELNVTAITDPRNRQTTMTYDAFGNMTSRRWPDPEEYVPNPSLYVENFTYDEFNNLKTYTDGQGAYSGRVRNTTRYDYDSAGNLVRVTEPDPDDQAGWSYPLPPPVTEYERDPAGTGLLVSVKDPLGKVTRFGHDADGNLTSVTTPLGAKRSMSYDPSGRMTGEVDPRGNEPGHNPADYRTAFTYDKADRPLTESDPLNNVTTYSYDAVGNLKSVDDANGNVTTYDYDETNYLTAVTAPGGNKTLYGYDAAHNLVSRRDPNDAVTTYGYDDARRLTSVRGPGDKLWTFSYDANGNVIKRIDANGNATSTIGDGDMHYTYDERDRLKTVKGDYTTTPHVTFSYDANSNVTKMSDGRGEERYRYDNLDQRTAASMGPSVTYDAAGHVTRRVYPYTPDSMVVTYGYDDDGRLAAVEQGGAMTNYRYDAADNLVETALPSANGHVESRAYDRAARLTDIASTKGSTVLRRIAYTLDGVGNPVRVVDNSQGTSTYAYDLRNRLSEACFQASCTAASDPSIRYTYDAVGNRLTEQRPSGTTKYTYDTSGQLTSAAAPEGTTTYEYDTNGNQTKAGNRTFVYDDENRVRSTTAGKTTTEYSYTGDGLRWRAASGTRAATITNYHWDTGLPVPTLLSETDGNGDLLRRYVYADDELLSMSSGGSDHFFHHDALGSTTNVTGADGTAEWTYGYEPFGALRSEVKNFRQAPTNLARFTGQLYDTDTASYYLRARQYDPSPGRFLGRDPAPASTGDPLESPYAYVSNRPTVLSDPTGRCPFCIVVGVGALIGGGAHGAETAITGKRLTVGGMASSMAGGAVGGPVGGVAKKAAAGLINRQLRGRARPAARAAVPAVATGAAGATLEAVGCGASSEGLLTSLGAGTAGAAVEGAEPFRQRGFNVRSFKGLVTGRNGRRLLGGSASGALTASALKVLAGNTGCGK